VLDKTKYVEKKIKNVEKEVYIDHPVDVVDDEEEKRLTI